MMRLRIDHDLCSGNGRCYALFPELFTDDDSGYGQTVNEGEIADDQVDQALRATLCCPEKAITIEGLRTASTATGARQVTAAPTVEE